MAFRNGKATCVLCGDGAGGTIAVVYRTDVTPAGAVDGVNDTFITPEFFEYEAGDPLGPQPYVNGARVALTDDYTVAESGGAGTGFDSIVFNAGKEPQAGDIIRVDYFVAGGTGGTADVEWQDEGVAVASRSVANLVGDDVVVVDNPANNRVNIIHGPAATYNSHWNTADGNNGDQSVPDPIARSTVRVSTPSGGEGTPFNTNGWAGTNQDGTLATTGTYTTPGTTTGFGGDSTMTVKVYDADGATELASFTTAVITGDGAYGAGDIVVTISSYGDDPSPVDPVAPKFSANASVFVDHDAILTGAGLSGGRFHVEISHTTDTTTDGGGTYTYTQSDVFQDKNPSTPAINGAVSIIERPGFILTKHLSGLEYYILNSEFNPSVADIDNFNANSQRISSMLQATGPDYGFSALNQEPFPGGVGESFFTGWTNDHDDIDVDWDYIGWAITTASYRFIGTTANISAFVRDPWAASSTINGANASILIDTFIAAPTATFDSFDDEAERELIDGIGAGASGGSFPGAGVWPSSTALASGEALVQASEILHPDAASVLDWSSYKPDLGGANPDYTPLAAQGFVDYGRRWTKTGGISIPSFSMVFTGTFAAGDMLADLLAGNVEMYVYRIARPVATTGNIGKPPTNPYPLRIHEAYNQANFDDGITTDLNSGIREGSSSGNTINCTFGGLPADTGFYWHLRILNSATKVASASVTFF